MQLLTIALIIVGFILSFFQGHVINPSRASVSKVESLTAVKEQADPAYEYKPNLTNEQKLAALGRSTWTLFHTIASVYPEDPTPEDQKLHLYFIKLLARLYPCPICSDHFQELLSQYPPKLENRNDFTTWLCEMHNRVNKNLNKPQFDCSRVNERWNCGCDALAENSDPIGVKCQFTHNATWTLF